MFSSKGVVGVGGNVTGKGVKLLCREQKKKKGLVSCAFSIRNFENSRVVVYERLGGCGRKGDILFSSSSASLYHDIEATFFSSSIYPVSLFLYSPVTEVVTGMTYPNRGKRHSKMVTR